MAYSITCDLTSIIEQGSITSGGDSYASERVRTRGRIAISQPTSATITAISNIGKTLQVDFMGYADSSTKTPICDLYWFDSPYTFDLSQYSGIQYVRAVIRNSDNTDISPADIASVTLEAIAEDAWYMSEDGYPRYSLSPEPPPLMPKPWPYILWRTDPQINHGYPYHELLPEIPALGAFANANNLIYARIPATVQKLGDQSFTNTLLKQVRISQDCTFGEETFPKGCLIEYYK